MGRRFNPPPSWPRPPAGWTPPPGWQPDPAWGPPPPGWELWVDDTVAPAFRTAPPPVLPRSSGGGAALVLVPLLTCGFAGFVPPLYAASRTRDPRSRRRLRAAAVVIGAVVVVGVLLTSLAPQQGGTSTGWAADLGGGLLFLNWLGSTGLAVAVRNPRAAEQPLPGVAEELARRATRDRYRRLVADDPAVARNIGVGRPDLPRTFDDGGLVDVNSAPVEVLARVLPAEEAVRVVEARSHLGRFSGVDEVAVYADLPVPTVDRLREVAVFL